MQANKKKAKRSQNITFGDGLTSQIEQSRHTAILDTFADQSRQDDQDFALVSETTTEVNLDTLATSYNRRPRIIEAEIDTADVKDTNKPLHWNMATSQVFRAKPQIARPHLRLSAFRRPENTVRLTKCDPSRTLESKYDLHGPGCRVLGHGAFACVRLAVRRRDGMAVAVKTIAKHEALRSRRLQISGRTYLEEWEILRRLHDNSNIISLLDVFESDDELQLVTEYCSGGELFDAIQKKRSRSQTKRRGQYTEVQAASVTKQILQALRDIHSRGIVHRDVKPENILLVDDNEATMNVKLCDFGMARLMYEPAEGSSDDGEASPLTPGRTRSFSLVGTDYYMAPEVRYGGTYDSAVDVYSLGVTLYILLCGFPPVFSGNDSDEVTFPVSYWKDISEEAKDLVRKMVNPLVEERITVVDALNHVWIVRSTDDVHKNEDDSERLNRVRQRLYKSLGAPKIVAASPKRKRCSDERQSPGKRRHERRASVALIALADLCRSSSSLAPTSASPKRTERKASLTGSTVAALSF